jgi:regulator of PEP synthase PpsR (kinase-PPPase family)
MTKWKELQTEFTEKIKMIEETLPHSLAEFSLEQIQNVQEHLKTLENKIKEKQKEKKVKTITISEEVHSKVKKFCVENDLKINDWVETKLLELVK